MTQKKTERLRERERAKKCKICHHKNTNGGEKNNRP